jgi:hypothetical protein
MKIVVLDLDETLGYFVEYGIFWDLLQKKYKLTQNNFNEILDLYPEFLRPNIINILNYLKQKKECESCDKLMMYTNNQGPEKWAHQIISYFETKINCKLFDQIISAFKINGKKIELCRTTHNKCHSDLIECTKIPFNTEICFLDDSYYPQMIHKNVYYIKVKPYLHNLKFEDMISRFINSEIGKQLVNEKEQNIFIHSLINDFKKYNFTYNNKNKDDYEIDVILSKQILLHLQEFFNKTKKIKDNKSKKNNKLKLNKTKKKY